MMKVSVIIPTYNRKNGLYETLDSLAHQTLPADCFEVIVVDDGSTDGTSQVTTKKYPFSLRYFYQTNQGDALARNFGVEQSQADLLVFLDDDVLVEADYLSHLVCEHQLAQNRIVVGTEYLWVEDSNPLAQNHQPLKRHNGHKKTNSVPFADICSNNMSIRREAYISLGKMQALDFPGSDIWCDVDFAYRAYQQNFEFLQSIPAICYHRDYVAQSLDNSKNRMRKVAYRAVVLFQKYPNLPPYLPMFSDKLPIIWGQDPTNLIIRKLIRQIMSTWLILKIMEWFNTPLERVFPSLSRHLRRWIVGGYIFQGYQEGLHEFGSIENSKVV